MANPPIGLITPLPPRAAALGPRRRRRDARRQARRAAGNPANQPPNVPDWSRYLGDGVAVRAYGKPSKHEAHVVRRDVEWLTAVEGKLGQLHAAACARRHHHAERALLRAPSCRHRRDRPRRLPADPARPRRQAADLHARRPQALPAREPGLFLRMRRELRHGVARRPAQRLPVHARHGPLRRCTPACRCSLLLQEAGLQAERQMAAARRRRRRRHDALAAAREGARRRARRLPHERRDAAARERLSGPHRAARLGSQHVGQVAAPHRGRRRALAHTARRPRNTPTSSRTARRAASPMSWTRNR